MAEESDVKENLNWGQNPGFLTLYLMLKEKNSKKLRLDIYLMKKDF